MLFLNNQNLFKNFNSFFKNKFFHLIICNLLVVKNFFVLNIKFDKLCIYLNNVLSFSVLLNTNQNSSFDFYGLTSNSIFLSIEHIKVQELVFLSEYFLITALFCLTLFALFSLKPTLDKKHFFIKFQYNNQLIFLLIFIMICYLILVYQQIHLSVLTISSFNDSIINDSFAIIAKFVIGFSSLCYLIFITQYLKDQKLNNFEYYIILLTSIFGFFLLCCANDFITAYLAIELQGLAFYVLAAFKKSSNFSIESGVKYFVIGSLSTALFLLGVTFVYGFTGSLILTDFNDFFIWSLFVNSSPFLFESMAKAFESFQVKTIDIESSFFTKLQNISDHLDLIKKKAFLDKLDFEFLKPTLSCASFNKAGELFEINLCKEIFEKVSELYYQMNVMGFMDKKLLVTNYVVLSLNSFLIESNFQNSSIELFYNFQENQISKVTFEHLKYNLIEANYYEEIGVENSKLQDQLFNFFKLNNILALDQYFDNTYQLFKSCYILECILNIVYFSEFLNLQDNVSLNEEVSMQFFNDFDLFLKNSKFDVNLELINLFEFRFYTFSVLNILNINNFFFDFSDVNSLQSSVTFDFNFIIFGIIIILLALLFKLALAPFHFWSPDVYEGSPSSSTFFFMVISKLGIFVFLLRICYSCFYSFISYWQFYSLIVATISIFIGAFAGLKQRKLKSLLTYSSINNMGFVLLAFSVGSFEGIQIQFYYLIVYILTSLCIWAIILSLKLKKKMYFEKQNRDLGDLALLQESNNIIAQNLAITLFSMAGLPPLVGFIAKMGVFKALSVVSIYFFSVINILFSVIATFYYLRIVKIIFFENILVGSLYSAINSKKVFLINLLNFLLGFLFISPVFLYLYSYKITLFINKCFY